MGQAICRLIAADATIDLHDVPSRDPRALFENAKVVIDFSRPELSVLLAAEAARTGKALVVGTTGLSAAQMNALRDAGGDAPVCYSANMSLGVNLLAALVEQAARALPDADIEILEVHHRHKLDAPSGTALLLGEAAASARGAALADISVTDRRGARAPGQIGFASVRGGDVVGDHSVMLAAEGEIITLSHRAQSRDIFAAGALKAALWLASQPNGFYSMRDVLGLV